MVPDGFRCSTAFRNADTANEAFIRESIEYPTILFEYTSLIAQR